MKPPVRIGILCGGGPAPGINSVISAATIEARNSGWDVVGIFDGFEHLIQGDASHVLPLSIPDVSRIHVLGVEYGAHDVPFEGAKRARLRAHARPTLRRPA